MTLKIPERHQALLAKIIELPESAIDSLLTALEKEQPIGKWKTGHNFPSIDGLSDADLERLSSTLTSLYAARAENDVPLSKFVADVVGAMRRSAYTGLQITKEQIPNVKARLTKLLSNHFLAVASKALVVQSDHEKTFCSAKILSDIRPVFENDPGEAPSGAVVGHTLKLRYHHEGRHREVYIFLTTEDIRSLQRVLERADKKAKSLRELLGKSGINSLEAPEE